MVGVSGYHLNMFSFRQANLKENVKIRQKIFFTAVASFLNLDYCHNPHLKAIV